MWCWWHVTAVMPRGVFDSSKVGRLTRGHCPREEERWLATHSPDRNGAQWGRNNVCTKQRRFLVSPTFSNLVAVIPDWDSCHHWLAVLFLFITSGIYRCTYLNLLSFFFFYIFGPLVTKPSLSLIVAKQTVTNRGLPVYEVYKAWLASCFIGIPQWYPFVCFLCLKYICSTWIIMPHVLSGTCSFAWR